MNTLTLIDKLFSAQMIIVYFVIIILFIAVYFILSSYLEKNKIENKNEKKKENINSDSNINTDETRFYQLSKIDSNFNDNAIFDDYDNTITLEEMCNDFRDYSANKLHLYYDIDDIRKFVASLATSKIIIIQGISGTGKTSLAYAFGEFLNNSSTIIPIQPMWKERSDLIGYYNEFTNHYNETTLLKKMYEANYSDNIYITVLDEMNIARVEYYFAEFLSLLELPMANERYLNVINDVWENDPKLLKNGQILLPNNMWFIGTANNDDSTFAISDKVYDRAMVLNLSKKNNPFNAKRTKPKHISFNYFESLTKNAVDEYQISERNKLRIDEVDKKLIELFGITFGNRIMKQLNTYVPVFIACGGSEIDAIDDFICKKILRKLNALNPILINSNVDVFIKYLDELFGKNEMKQCIDFLKRL